jgi:hypothetical protein
MLGAWSNDKGEVGAGWLLLEVEGANLRSRMDNGTVSAHLFMHNSDAATQ